MRTPRWWAAGFPDRLDFFLLGTGRQGHLIAHRPQQPTVELGAAIPLQASLIPISTRPSGPRSGLYDALGGNWCQLTVSTCFITWRSAESVHRRGGDCRAARGPDRHHAGGGLLRAAENGSEPATAAIRRMSELHEAGRDGGWCWGGFIDGHGPRQLVYLFPPPASVGRAWWDAARNLRSYGGWQAARFREESER